jgi:hypothetical protein
MSDLMDCNNGKRFLSAYESRRHMARERLRLSTVASEARSGQRVIIKRASLDLEFLSFENELNALNYVLIGVAWWQWRDEKR